MKKLFLLFLFAVGTQTGFAQFVTCQSMPLAHNAGFVFETSTFTGDSVIKYSLTNTSATNFAYPLTRLEAITPLPTGMTLNSSSAGWNVFASSWNINDTNAVEIYYDVIQAIPANYTVDFLLYVSNFLPLTIDSCVFTDTITINLNPTGFAGVENTEMDKFTIYPNPASDFVIIQFENPDDQQWVDVSDMHGEIIISGLLKSGERMDLHSFKNGIYLIKPRSSLSGQKLVVNH